MKVIKILGKLLALPFSISLFVILVGIFPLRLLINWLNGYGKYNKVYLTFARDTIKKAWYAALRKEHPVLKNFLIYQDEQEAIILDNDKQHPTTSRAIPASGVITICG